MLTNSRRWRVLLILATVALGAAGQTIHIGDIRHAEPLSGIWRQRAGDDARWALPASPGERNGLQWALRNSRNRTRVLQAGHSVQSTAVQSKAVRRAGA